MYIGYVYKFTLIPTNKIYVGKRTRSEFDEKYYGSGKYWKRALNKYSTSDVKREILQWCSTQDELCEAEKFWIKELDATNPNIGYNLSLGGKNPILVGENNPMFGNVWDEEHRKYQGEIFTRYKKEHGNCSENPEIAQKISNSLKGHEVSEQTREKLRYYNIHKIYITDGINNKTILPEKLDEFLNSGWKLGRTKKNKDSCISITNGKINKFIKPEDFLYYEQLGYKKGKTISKEKSIESHNKAKQTISNWSEERKLEVFKHRSAKQSGKNNGRYGVKRAWVNNGIIQKQIKFECLDEYLSKGYIRGRIK